MTSTTQEFIQYIEDCTSLEPIDVLRNLSAYYYDPEKYIQLSNVQEAAGIFASFLSRFEPTYYGSDSIREIAIEFIKDTLERYPDTDDGLQESCRLLTQWDRIDGTFEKHNLLVQGMYSWHWVDLKESIENELPELITDTDTYLMDDASFRLLLEASDV